MPSFTNSAESGTRYAFALTGLVVASLGLLLVLAATEIASFANPWKSKEEIASEAERMSSVAAHGERVIRPVKKAQPNFSLAAYLIITGMILGLLGIISGMVARFRREYRRLACSAILVGTFAVAAHFIIVSILFNVGLIIKLLRI